jgi:hypothetical protein
MGCNTFSDWVCHCIPYDDTITLNTSVEPDTAYTWVITDKFRNRYSGDVTSEADGKIVIPIAALPDGLLNQFGGVFVLELEGPGSCGPIKFPMTQMVELVNIEVHGGTQEKNTIGCEVVCNNTASSLIPFEDVDEVIIDWDTYASVYGNSPTVSVYVEESPGVYNLVAVEVTQERTNGVLTQVTVNLGGIATGYIIITG